MTIDGINISVFGLHLSKADGFLDQPGRKVILPEPSFQAKDIVFESKEISIELVGIYETKAELFTGVESLKNLIKNTLEHDFVLPGHGIVFSGVVDRGISVKSISTMCKIYFRVTVTI